LGALLAIITPIAVAIAFLFGLYLNHLLSPLQDRLTKIETRVEEFGKRLDRLDARAARADAASLLQARPTGAPETIAEHYRLSNEAISVATAKKVDLPRDLVADFAASAVELLHLERWRANRHGQPR
jgi:hypothetical protein